MINQQIETVTVIVVDIEEIIERLIILEEQCLLKHTDVDKTEKEHNNRKNQEVFNLMETSTSGQLSVPVDIYPLVDNLLHRVDQIEKDIDKKHNTMETSMSDHPSVPSDIYSLVDNLLHRVAQMEKDIDKNQNKRESPEVFNLMETLMSEQPSVTVPSDVYPLIDNIFHHVGQMEKDIDKNQNKRERPELVFKPMGTPVSEQPSVPSDIYPLIDNIFHRVAQMEKDIDKNQNKRESPELVFNLMETPVSKQPSVPSDIYPLVDNLLHRVDQMEKDIDKTRNKRENPYIHMIDMTDVVRRLNKLESLSNTQNIIPISDIGTLNTYQQTFDTIIHVDSIRSKLKKNHPVLEDIKILLTDVIQRVSKLETIDTEQVSIDIEQYQIHHISDTQGVDRSDIESLHSMYTSVLRILALLTPGTHETKSSNESDDL